MGYVWKIIWDSVWGFFDRANTIVTNWDFTQWIWVLAVACAFGFFMLRGHTDKIGS